MYKKLQPDDVIELLPVKEEKVPFQLVYNPILISILQKDIPEKGALDPQEADSLIVIYENRYHPDFSIHFFRQLKFAPKQKTARKIFEAIWNWETRRSGHASEKEAVHCLMNATSEDLELQKWILDVLGWGFFAILKQRLLNLVPRCFKNNKVITILDFLNSATQTFLFYWDIFKDFATYAIFNHMSSNILVSNFKRLHEIRKQQIIQ